MDLNYVLERMTEMVNEVSKYQLENYRSKNLKIDRKSTQTDLVTEVDKKSEKMIIDKIKEFFPLHNILTEETGTIGTDSDYTWIVDPLDGTNNFACGLPIFGISIALEYKNEIIAGIVHMPYLKETYWATKNNGSYCNGNRINCGAKRELIECMAATGFPYDKHINDENNLNEINKIIPTVRGIRRLGSAAYDLCLVAHGVYDIYWEMGIKKWDVAAGQIIIEEAGGKVQYINSRRKIALIVGNSEIVEIARKKINW